MWSNGEIWHEQWALTAVCSEAVQRTALQGDCSLILSADSRQIIYVIRMQEAKTLMKQDENFSPLGVNLKLASSQLPSRKYAQSKKWE